MRRPANEFAGYLERSLLKQAGGDSQLRVGFVERGTPRGLPAASAAWQVIPGRDVGRGM